MMQDKVASKAVQNLSASLVAFDKAICCIKEDIATLTGQVGGNIYTQDGTLEENRTLVGDGNSLTLTGISVYTLSAGALSITALTGATTFNSASTFTINSGVDLVFNVTGEITVTQALAHDIAPDSFVVLSGVGLGTLSYLTPEEVLTSIGGNIYTLDGTLTSERTVTGAGFSLIFTGLDDYTIDNTGEFTISSQQNITLESITATISLTADSNILIESTVGDIQINSLAANTQINTVTLGVSIGGSVGASGDVLTSDGLGGVTWQAPSGGGGGGGNTIYSANDTLTSNRTVGGAGFNLTFNNSPTITLSSSVSTVIGSTLNVDVTAAEVSITGGIGLTQGLAFLSSGEVLFKLPTHFSTPTGALVQTVGTNNGEIDYTPYTFPTSLGAGDDGKGLVYDHGTTSFTMAAVADTNFAQDDLTFTGDRTHNLDVHSLVLDAFAGSGEIQIIMGSGDFLVTGNGMKMGLNNAGGELSYILSHNASIVAGKKEVVRTGQVGGLPGGLTRGVDVGVFSDPTTPDDPTGGVALELIRVHELGIEVITANAQHVININNVSDYASNAAAIIGGLVVGDIYRNGGQLMIVI